MSLQIEWQYLQRTVPGAGTMIGPIEDALREDFFHALFGVEEVNADLREILVHSMKRGGLGIPDPGCRRSVRTTTPNHSVSHL